MKLSLLIVLFLFVVILNGCGELTKSPPDKKQAVASVPVQQQGKKDPNSEQIGRFVPLPEYPGNPLITGVPRPYVALDTSTGRLCKTWDWNIPGSGLNNIENCIEFVPLSTWSTLWSTQSTTH
jgi:hypothetical protein